MAANPGKNALFGVVPETRGLQGLDGGVRSHMRTGLHLRFPANREFYREFCDFGMVSESRGPDTKSQLFPFFPPIKKGPHKPHRGRFRCRARLERLDPAACKIAAPQAHRILANAERFRNAWTGPPHNLSNTALARSASPRSAKLRGSAMPPAALHSPPPEIYLPCPA